MTEPRLRITEADFRLDYGTGSWDGGTVTTTPSFREPCWLILPDARGLRSQVAIRCKNGDQAKSNAAALALWLRELGVAE